MPDEAPSYTGRGGNELRAAVRGSGIEGIALAIKLPILYQFFVPVLNMLITFNNT